MSSVQVQPSPKVPVVAVPSGSHQEGILDPIGNMLDVLVDEPTFQESSAVASERLLQP